MTKHNPAAMAADLAEINKRMDDRHALWEQQRCFVGRCLTAPLTIDCSGSTDSIVVPAHIMRDLSRGTTENFVDAILATMDGQTQLLIDVFNTQYGASLTL